jgi:type II secretory pathway pseudopilin PulG
MRKSKAERGMSLVEVTIILMVLATLTAVIAPSAGDYISDARQVRAKEEVEVLGTGIARLLRDVGTRCLRDAGATACTKANRIDLLVSGGADPKAVTPADFTYADADQAITAADNWLPDAQAPAAGNLGTFDDHLVDNNDGSSIYSDAALFTSGGGPRMVLGWRGAYVPGPTDSDPWGAKYQANTIFLASASDATDVELSAADTVEGYRGSGWQKDAFVLSAGANGIVETPWAATATVGSTAVGDDVIYIIRGSTR